MTDTEEMVEEQNTGDLEQDQSSGPDYETIEPKEDNEPHFQAFHDPPDPEDKPES